jgi:hypothetical protein
MAKKWKNVGVTYSRFKPLSAEQREQVDRSSRERSAWRHMSDEDRNQAREYMKQIIDLITMRWRANHSCLIRSCWTALVKAYSGNGSGAAAALMEPVLKHR